MLLKLYSIISLKITGKKYRVDRIAVYSIIFSSFITLLIWPFIVSARADTAPVGRTNKIFQALKEEMKFSDSELSKIEEGDLTTKLINTDEKQELFLVSITRINVPESFFLNHYGKDVSLLENLDVKNKGQIMGPPKLSELQDAKLDTKEIEALKKCKVGKCGLKVSSEMIDRFQNEIDWSQSGYKEKANRLFREMLFEYIKAYLSGGNRHLITYDDQIQPLSLEQVFNNILNRTSFLFNHSPALYKYLETFPIGKPDGVNNLIYWKKEDIGANYNVLSVNQIIKFIPNDPLLNPVIVSKQIYADHYFEAALGITKVVENTATTVPSVYLLYINRSSIDVLRRDGLLNGTIRRKIESRLVDSINERMKTIKDKIEALYKGQVG